jgi:AI-2E family transporter
METAAHTVGHYLLLFSLTNLGFGVACGLVTWFLGLPNAFLWGLLAFLLRFIPYVGAMTSAILPALVAFASFPGGPGLSRLWLLKTWSARTETHRAAWTARGVADEFEVAALSWTGVMKSGAIILQREVLSRPRPQPWRGRASDGGLRIGTAA